LALGELHASQLGLKVHADTVDGEENRGTVVAGGEDGDAARRRGDIAKSKDFRFVTR
jgi:hypothetical protein